jgi:hypothetical protein
MSDRVHELEAELEVRIALSSMRGCNPRATRQAQRDEFGEKVQMFTTQLESMQALAMSGVQGTTKLRQAQTELQAHADNLEKELRAEQEKSARLQKELADTQVAAPGGVADQLQTLEIGSGDVAAPASGGASAPPDADQMRKQLVDQQQEMDAERDDYRQKV